MYFQQAHYKATKDANIKVHGSVAEQFYAYDTDDSGFLDKEEILDFCSKLGLNFTSEEARQALKRPEGRTLKKSSSRSRVVPARRRGRRRDDDDDTVTPVKAKAEDDDEVEVVVGGSLLLMGFGWWFGGISLVSLTLCLRRAIVTRGRSLDPRRLGRKEKAELPL